MIADGLLLMIDSLWLMTDSW